VTNSIWIGDALLVIVVIFSFVSPAFFAMRTRQLETSIRLSADFFDLANKLVEDDDTPELLIDYLDSMAVVINERRFSRMILWLALTGKLRETSNAPGARALELMSVIRGLRKEVKDMVARASASCMLSVTYKSPIFGILVRRMMFYSIERDQEQAEIVASHLFSDGLGRKQAHA